MMQLYMKNVDSQSAAFCVMQWNRQELFLYPNFIEWTTTRHCWFNGFGYGERLYRGQLACRGSLNQKAVSPPPPSPFPSLPPYPLVSSPYPHAFTNTYWYAPPCFSFQLKHAFVHSTRRTVCTVYRLYVHCGRSEVYKVTAGYASLLQMNSPSWTIHLMNARSIYNI